MSSVAKPLQLIGVGRAYRSGGERLVVLESAELTLRAGEIVALVAPSGTGKSTLLHLAGLLERPDVGRIMIDGVDAGILPDAGRTQMRRDRIGFVYQFHHLLPEFTALENVVLPQMIAQVSEAQARRRAIELLGQLGLQERLHHLPGKLSGGEQQRVAIARALANAPGLVLADEPTGNLDAATSQRVFDQLLGVVRGQGVAALIATHNPELAARMDRRVTLRDRRIVGV